MVTVERILVRETYQERRARFDAARRREETRGYWLGRVRVGVFLIGLALYLGADLARDPWAAGLAMGVWAAALTFLLLLVWHRRVRAREKRYQALARINGLALARRARDWPALPASPFPPPDREHPYAGDLDFAGERSLFALFTTLTLPPGVDTLRAWLLAPAPPDEIRRRQEAVEELAGKVDLRESVEAEGRLGEPPSLARLEGFLRWTDGEDWLAGRRWLRGMGWVVPLLNLTLLLLWLGRVIPGAWCLLSPLGGLVLGYALQPRIHAILLQVSEGQERIARYAAVLSVLRTAALRAPALTEIQDRIRGGALDAVRELRRLGRRVGWADVRYSMMAHALLQALLLWDVHVLAGLEGWRRSFGDHVRGWLEALGRFEALAALAALRADHPEWSFPVIREGGVPGVRGRELGHPLLPSPACVGNDVEVGPPGTFLFITGSNMSGKSTFLRAVGVNVALAQAGGPVCAREMELTSLDVQSCMRTTDSLTEGVSQFMAELNGIQRVVQAARRGGGEGGAPTVLYLLDEPLQGTNEAERRVAVQTILGHLLEAGAVGAVATHDLRLDGTAALAAAARAAHFEGTVQEGEGQPLLSFDYRLKPGRATSTNALALLRAVGLGAREPS